MGESQEKAVQISVKPFSVHRLQSWHPWTPGSFWRCHSCRKVKSTVCKDGCTLLNLERVTEKLLKLKIFQSSRITAQNSNPVSSDRSLGPPHSSVQCPSQEERIFFSQEEMKTTWTAQGRDQLDHLVLPTMQQKLLPTRNFPNCSIQPHLTSPKQWSFHLFSWDMISPCRKPFLARFSFWKCLHFNLLPPLLSPACKHLWTTLMKQINTKKELQFRNKLVYFPFILYQNPSTCQRKSESPWNLPF